MFDQKGWLDDQIVPLLGDSDPLKIYSALWNGTPPTEVLVFLLAPADPPSAWGIHVKRLLDNGWRFDFLREQQMVKADEGVVPIFGGDGAPLFGKDGMTSVRLFKRLTDRGDLAKPLERACIVQVGCRFGSALVATQAIKDFFKLFDLNPLEVCAAMAAPFGAA